MQSHSNGGQGKCIVFKGITSSWKMIVTYPINKNIYILQSGNPECLTVQKMSSQTILKITALLKTSCLRSLQNNFHSINIFLQMYYKKNIGQIVFKITFLISILFDRCIIKEILVRAMYWRLSCIKNQTFMTGRQYIQSCDMVTDNRTKNKCFKAAEENSENERVLIPLQEQVSNFYGNNHLNKDI